jgi:hypothetical protein
MGYASLACHPYPRCFADQLKDLLIKTSTGQQLQIMLPAFLPGNRTLYYHNKPNKPINCREPAFTGITVWF